MSSISKLNRRKFLTAGTGVAMGITLLPYKSMAAEEKKMNLYSWDSYLGENTLAEFKDATGVEVKLDLYHPRPSPPFYFPSILKNSNIRCTVQITEK